MNHLGQRRWLPWIGLAIVLACAAILISVRHGQPAPAPLLVLRRPFSPPVRLRDKVEFWIPNTGPWAWAHHLVDAAFGKRKPINLDAESFTFSEAFSSRAIEVELGPPAYAVQQQGLSIWFLTYGDLTALRTRLEAARLGNSYRCRVNTGDGVGAGVFMGSPVVVNGQTNQLGIHEDYYPMIGSSGTDLFLSLQMSGLVTNPPPRLELTEPSVFIETNVDLAVRIQIPARRGVFLVKREPSAEGGRSAALLLDPH